MWTQKVTFVLLGVIVFTNTGLADNIKRCYAPVFCSMGKTSEESWQQVYPPPTCQRVEGDTHNAIKGDQGERGPPGPPGPPGTFNSSSVDSIKKEISAMVVRESAMIATIERLNESIASLKDENRKKEQVIDDLRVANMNSTMQQEFNVKYASLESRILELEEKQKSCIGGVFYKGKCFWFVQQSVTYAQGEAICSTTPGGRVAIVYNDENYQQIQVYMRSLMTGWTTFFYFWLGLKFDLASGRVVTLPGETEAPFKKWRPGGYPTKSSSYTNVVLSVYKNPSSPNQGMWNTDPTSTVKGVLCEA